MDVNYERVTKELEKMGYEFDGDVNMDLDYEKVTKVLKTLGYEPGNKGNEHVWRKVIDGIPYAVDFKTNEVFRMMYGSREYDVPGDEHLLKLKTTVEDVMSAMNSERREAEAEPSTTKEEPETPANVPSETKEDKPVEAVKKVPAKPVTRKMSNDDLTKDNIRQYLCPTATDQELFMFLQLCEHRNLNPFIKEAYLVKYNNTPATLIVGKDAFTKKAEEHPQFDGFEAGVIVENAEGIEYRPGQLVRKGEELIGGWAQVHRKDRQYPYRSEVSMQEYNTNQFSWKKLPATMIRKVALVQALREAFPSDLGGCYDSAEMGVQ